MIKDSARVKEFVQGFDHGIVTEILNIPGFFFSSLFLSLIVIYLSLNL